MHNAESKTKHKEDSFELRHRKYKEEKSSDIGRKMVGSGNGEILGHDLDNIKMELFDFNSDDDINEELDTKKLISSPLNDESVKKTDNSKNLDTKHNENVWSISIQMFIPFLLAGFGMVAASLLLDVVQVRRGCIFLNCRQICFQWL
jgi:solute carrier family 41